MPAEEFTKARIDLRTPKGSVPDVAAIEKGCEVQEVVRLLGIGNIGILEASDSQPDGCRSLGTGCHRSCWRRLILRLSVCMVNPQTAILACEEDYRRCPFERVRVPLDDC